MKRSRFIPPAALLLLVAASGAGCGRAGPTPEPPPPAGPNAFDTIKLGRISDEIGPVYFAHDLHADLADARGRTIPCERCHHPVPGETGPPRGCFNCHLPHDRAGETDRPST